MRAFNTQFWAVGLALAVMGAATAAAATPAEIVDDMHRGLDAIWLTAAALVLLMQSGFMLIEAGAVRSKNSINVAQKNFLDFVVAGLLYIGIGYMLMFGDGANIGWDLDIAFFQARSNEEWSFIVFQTTLCGAAATIASGAVAERFGLAPYLVLTAVLVVVIYPLFGHWVWGGALHPDEAGWLAALGFHDFAGSTVVHSLGGWLALVAAVMVGPRLGRFAADGRVLPIQGHSAVLSTLGALTLFVGWIGFNSGWTLLTNDDVGGVVAVTVLGATAGGFSGSMLGLYRDRLWRTDRSINGLLGGLVAVSAGCNVMPGYGGVAVGALGGLVATLGSDFLERLRVDDPVGAVPVHCFGGILGSLTWPFFAPVDAMPAGDLFTQLGAQAVGVTTCAVWTVSTSYLAIKAIDPFLPIRVSEKAERDGLNVAEHGESLGLGLITQRLEAVARSTGGYPAPIELEPGDEAADLAQMFNALIARLEAEDAKRGFEARTRALQDADRLKREQAQRQELERRRALEAAIVARISEVLDATRDGDLTRRVDGSGLDGALKAVSGGVDGLLDLAGRMIGDVGGYARNLREVIDSQTALARRLSITADEQSRMAGDAADNLKRMGRAFGASRNAVAGALTAIDAAEAASQDGATEAETATRVVEALAASAERAMSVIGEITRIAQQTNMLAINAAIEAARAGVHGRSFGVVAQEVTRLAHTTRELSEKSAAILAETKLQVDLSSAAIGSTTGALGRVLATAETARDAVAEIERQAAAQAAENAALLETIEALKLSSTDNRGAAQAVAATSEVLRMAGDELVAGVARYRLPEPEANAAAA